MSDCLENTCIGSGVGCVGLAAVPVIVLASPGIILVVGVALPFVIVGCVIGGGAVAGYYGTKGIIKGTRHCVHRIEENLEERRELKEAQQSKGLKEKRGCCVSFFNKDSKKAKVLPENGNENEPEKTKVDLK